MGKGDGQRPRFVPYETYAERYDRIFGEEQRAPAADADINPAAWDEVAGSPAPWDDEVMDREMECLDCMSNPCRCEYERMEDEYRE